LKRRQAYSPPIWPLRRGDGRVVATAIHDGTGLRDEIAAEFAGAFDNKAIATV
jgi:hypothetical protein